MIAFIDSQIIFTKSNMSNHNDRNRYNYFILNLRLEKRDCRKYGSGIQTIDQHTNVAFFYRLGPRHVFSVSSWSTHRSSAVWFSRLPTNFLIVTNEILNVRIIDLSSTCDLIIMIRQIGISFDILFKRYEDLSRCYISHTWQFVWSIFWKRHI